MPERFFAGNTPPVSPAADHLSLLSGPPACGKTSLLFQFAINCAADNARTVVFICNKKRLDHKPPFLSREICLLECF
ncbi:hypothetical protein KSP40_PGU012105 [Platanthera guangdongensis]|uniref:KaiC-like domain-containing protein n=1 Tax=Platanthera guangdongensis TaxID=2320717 RepID=A0ABR2MUF1_9ASPA